MTSDQYRLPDGRSLTARVFDTEPENEQLGPLWELVVDGETLIGHPLNSALAELLGWNIAHEGWPEWIDELAASIAADAQS